tara:strand:+ start:4563 stop:5948 length:1386 start_codon:yes stop_codon:yes gene_type:complete
MEDSFDSSKYLWIVASGGILSIFAAFGIGANDVANAFATAIGSGALTVKSSLVLAAIFEFSGALFMGSHVTKTIRKGIADYECFEEDPAILMYGCMCVIMSVGIWLLVASKLSLPVSTTHSAVGGMIGMTLVTAGPSCISWNESTNEFPYRTGVTAIIISWFLSPILSGICSVFLFLILRHTCLRTENPFHNIWKFYPFIIGSTVTINAFFILWKGLKNMSNTIEAWSIGKVVGISFGIGGCVALSSIPFLHKLKQYVTIQRIPDTPSLTLDKITFDIHENAEKFDQKSEEGLKYLQIFTSICDSFAHGANDVANAIGPFAAIFMIYKNEDVNKSADMGTDAYWILGLGGFGIVLGLAFYGQNIINTMGTRLCKITPSRGICIELGAAIVIITGARYGWPLSTTHCQIGATTAIALLEGSNGLNWKIIFQTCIGWIITLVIVGGLAAFLTAQGIYAPEKDY